MRFFNTTSIVVGLFCLILKAIDLFILEEENRVGICVCVAGGGEGLGGDRRVIARRSHKWLCLFLLTKTEGIGRKSFLFLFPKISDLSPTLFKANRPCCVPAHLYYIIIEDVVGPKHPKCYLNWSNACCTQLLYIQIYLFLCICLYKVCTHFVYNKHFSINWSLGVLTKKG